MNLAEWRDGVRGRPLRSFIYHKMTHQSTAERQHAINRLVGQVPPSVRGSVQDRLAGYALLAHASEFWRVDCAEFVDSVSGAFTKCFSQGGEPISNDQLFDLFELTSLMLVREVETNRMVRRASGIGRFAAVVWGALAIGVGLLAWRLLH